MRGHTLQTTRLLLRPFTNGDAPQDIEDAFHYRNDNEFIRYLPHIPHPFTRTDAEQFVTTNIEEPWSQYPTFAVTLDRHLIGTVNLEIDPDTRTAMLGYAISRDRWGEGIAPEAARAVIDWAFETLDLTRIWASTDARHTRSRRVLEKLGLRYEETRHADHVDRDGAPVDEVVYALSREARENNATSTPMLINLSGRELEPAVHALLAAAQIHRTPEEAASRGPAIAAEYAATPAHDLWALEDDGHIVAVAGVEFDAGKSQLELNDLAVDERFRRTGLGRAVIEALRSEYPGAVIEGNTIPQAAPFYESVDFEVTDTGAVMPSGDPLLRFTRRPDPPTD